MVETLNYLHAVCGEEKCVETCVKTTDQSAVKRVKTCQLGLTDWCNSVLALPAGSDGGTPSKARAKTPTHRLLTPPFETENIPVYTPPTDQQSTNLPGGQLNSRAGIVKEKKCARGTLSSNQRLEQMGQILAFKPVETEPDIWLKTKIKSETGGTVPDVESTPSSLQLLLVAS